MVPVPTMLDNIQNSERYFASLMNTLVDNLGISETNQSFACRVDDLFYALEAVNFLVDRGIFTNDATCQAVYNIMMAITGVYASNLTKDDSLIIPEI
jgi:hypothetical protein